MPILQFLAKVLIKFLLLDGSYLRRKLMLVPVVYGPSDRLKIGHGVNLQNVILNTNSGTIEIGDYSFFGHECMVLTGRHDASLRDAARINAHPISGNDIKIGKGVWVSSGAIILGGVSISDNSVIAAGAVVTKDCLRPAVYAGIPARIIAEIEK